MSSRRLHLSTLAAAVLSACTGASGLGMGLAPRLDPNDPDAALKHKFRGIRGGELIVSGMREFDTGNTYIYRPDGGYFAMGISGPGVERRTYGVGGNSKLPMPKYLRLVRYSKEPIDSYLPYPSSTVEFEITVPVAERIPEELLADLRRDPKGSLRLKLRVHPDTLLIGWDIERRPGFDAKKANEGQHYPAAFSHTGGDFKEMRIARYIDAKSPCQECVAFARSVKKTPSVVYTDDPNGYITMPTADDLNNQLPEVLAKNGYFLTPIGEVYSPYGSGRQLREKGWYIHPKTGERIETDF